MNKEQIIQVYLMNSPRVVAEMLYDTIERYEEKLTKCIYTKSCKDCEHDFRNTCDREHFCYSCSEYYTSNFLKRKKVDKEFFIDDCKDCTYSLSSRSEKEPYCSVCREYNKIGEKND